MIINYKHCTEFIILLVMVCITLFLQINIVSLICQFPFCFHNMSLLFVEIYEFNREEISQIYIYIYKTQKVLKKLVLNMNMNNSF